MEKKNKEYFLDMNNNLELKMCDTGFSLWYRKGKEIELLLDASLIKKNQQFCIGECGMHIKIDSKGKMHIINK